MGKLADLGLSFGGDVLSTGLGILTNNMIQKQNYQWSEKAAEKAFNRQLALYNRMYQDKSPENVVKQLEEAGLSKSLMFSGGASGVGGAASGTSAPQANQFQTQGTNKVNLALTAAQLRNMEANTAKTEAEKDKIEADTKTTDVTRDAVLNKLISEGHGQWLKNFQEQYKMNTPKPGEHIDYNDPNKGYYGNDQITHGSLFTEEITSNITKTLADAGNSAAQELLTNKKAEGYFTELLNDTMRADSAKIQATAQKLASEWNTGEFTNWKTWADLASKAISTLK